MASQLAVVRIADYSLDDGWANATTNPGASTAPGVLNNAATAAAGAANYAYGTIAGDDAAKKAGKEDMFGSS